MIDPDHKELHFYRKESGTDHKDARKKSGDSGENIILPEPAMKNALPVAFELRLTLKMPESKAKTRDSVRVFSRLFPEVLE